MRTLPWLLLGLVACNSSPSGDVEGDADTDADGDADTDADTDADILAALEGQTWLEDYEMTFFHLFEDWAGIELGVAVGTDQGPVIQDLSETDPTIIVPGGLGVQTYRALPLEVSTGQQLATVGPSGVWTTPVTDGMSEFGFGQVHTSTATLDIVPMGFGSLDFAVADFALGRVDGYRWNGFGFESVDYGDLPYVTALWPVSERRVYAATEPSMTDPGGLYEVQLNEAGGSATKLADIGVGPRDILCEEAYCLISCVLSGEVWFYDRTTRRVEPYKWADKQGAVGLGRNQTLGSGDGGLATATYILIGSEETTASVAEVDASGKQTGLSTLDYLEAPYVDAPMTTGVIADTEVSGIEYAIFHADAYGIVARMLPE